MSVDPVAPFALQGLVIVILTCVWTAMMMVVRARQLSHRVHRIALASCVAVTAALVAWGVVWSRPQPKASDLAPIWASARARLRHQDPYEAVGPGRMYDTDFPQIYPMTAMVAIMPLGLMPLRWADPLFVAVGFGLFTWAVTKKRLLTPALVALVSLGALMTVQTSQWSLVLTGAALVPVFGWLLVAKPTIGLALFAAFPRWKTAIGCLALLVVSILVWPPWIGEWRATLASAPHVVPPLTRRVGPLVLLALMKWKRADARLLLALACVPHTTAPYETIPLFLIPQTWPQAWILWTLGFVAYVAQWLSGPYASQAAYWASGAEWIVALLYLPCLAMVLCRPNASD
jgi:hypothetical protein